MENSLFSKFPVGLSAVRQAFQPDPGVSTFVPLFQGNRSFEKASRAFFCGRGSSLVRITPPVVPLELWKNWTGRILGLHSSELAAENARGAGAPAHASCRMEPIPNLFTAPLARGDKASDLRPGVGQPERLTYLKLSQPDRFATQSTSHWKPWLRNFYILSAGETPAPQPGTTTASIVVQATSLPVRLESLTYKSKSYSPAKKPHCFQRELTKDYRKYGELLW